MIELNGVEIQMPSQHGWRPRQELDINGTGFTVYSNYRSYNMQWQGLLPEDYYALQQAYDACAAAGGCEVVLPYYCSGTYTYQAYAGAILQEPAYERYFAGTYRNVTMTITGLQ